MKSWMIGALLLFRLAAPAWAADGAISRYAETIWLEDGGSARVDIEADLPAGAVGVVQLPVGASLLTDVGVSGIDRATAALVNEGDRHYLSVTIPAALPASTTLRVSGEIPQFLPAMRTRAKAFGNRTLSYRFLNSTRTVFAAVRVVIVLPAGSVVTAIEDSEPPASEANAAPPFGLVSRGGLHAVSIDGANIGLGGTVSVAFRFKQRQVSPLIPVVLLVVGGAYLVGFRHLRNQPEASR